MSYAKVNELYIHLPEVFENFEPNPGWIDENMFLEIDDIEGENIGPPRIDSSFQNKQENLTVEMLESIGAEILAERRSQLDGPLGFQPVHSGDHPGGPGNYPGRLDSERNSGQPPSPDCLAFYLPFHFFRKNNWWGIYIRFEGVLIYAWEIIERARKPVDEKDALYAARLFLFYHEAYHHKTECFSGRLESSHREPFYKIGFQEFYKKVLGTDENLEEGLANAHALRKVNNKLKNPVILDALRSIVADDPPGYRRGVEFSKEKKYKITEYGFAEKNHNACLPAIPPKDPGVWEMATHMFTPITNFKSSVNYILPMSSPIASRLPLRPKMAPRKLIKKLRKLVGLEFFTHGRSHDIYVTAKGLKTTIPRHAKDLGTGLTREILKQCGLEMSINQFIQQ